ncbi:MAG: WxPxxD family membrane protein [Bacilli bacterium]
MKSKLMKSKAIVLLITTIFFIAFWIISNSFKFESMKIMGINASLPMFNDDCGAYTSVLSYNVIYVIPFILFLYNLSLKEKDIIVVRNKTRKYFFIKRLKQLVISSLLFSFLNILVNSLLMLWPFDFKFLLVKHFFTYSILHMFILILHFILIGFVFYIFYDLLKSMAQALLVTEMCFALPYFLKRVGIITFWIPANNVTILSKFLYGYMNTQRMLLYYASDMAIIILLYGIGVLLYERKNFYNVKK